MEPHDVGGNLTDSAMENIAENSNFASTNVIEAAESGKVSALENALEKAASQDITSDNTQISSNLTESLLIGADTATQTTQGVGRANHDGVTYLTGRCNCAFHCLASLRHRNLQVNLVQLLNEEVTVLGIHDSLY